MILRLDLYVGRVAFRLHAPADALRMPYYELSYFARYVAEVEKHEKEQIERLRGK